MNTASVIRSGWGIWFVLYVPGGIVLATFLDKGLSFGRTITGAAILALANFILLWVLRKNNNGIEMLFTRPCFVFVPAVIGSLAVFLIGATARYEIVNLMFNMILAEAIFGFWLPRDDRPDKAFAADYYHELRSYVWPAMFLFGSAFLLGTWQFSQRLGGEITSLLFVAYIGSGFGSSLLVLFHNIDTLRRTAHA